MANITLVTGGTRSGKSYFAVECAQKYPEKRLFIATALSFDDEMRDRIEKHRNERGDAFTTIEAPYDLANVLNGIDGNGVNVILVDCLTIWLGNMMYQFDNNENAVITAITVLCKSLDNVPADTIIVTNEVGMGIVPDNALARTFRDMAGILNRRVAEKATNVVMTVCGIPMKIK